MQTTSFAPPPRHPPMRSLLFKVQPCCDRRSQITFRYVSAETRFQHLWSHRRRLQHIPFATQMAFTVPNAMNLVRISVLQRLSQNKTGHAAFSDLMIVDSVAQGLRRWSDPSTGCLWQPVGQHQLIQVRVLAESANAWAGECRYDLPAECKGICVGRHRPSAQAGPTAARGLNRRGWQPHTPCRK